MIDYKLLLIKYIAHVGTIEGVDFLGKHYSPENTFSPEELSALREAEQLSLDVE